MKRLSYIFLLLFMFVFGAESFAQFGGGGGGISQPPATPPTPSVSTNNCGNKTLTRSNPPSGQVYYWQTTYNGTSTSNSSSTWSVSASGTYYLRARANSSGLWSHAANVSVTVNGYPSTPSTPSVSSNTCGNKTLTRGGPPSGVTWYWQGTNSNGYSTSNSSSTYAVSSSGTYYIRARSSAGCWSSSRAVGVTVNGYPSTPSTPSVSSNTCGNKTLTRGNPPSGVTWYWQGTNSNGYSTSNSSSTYAVSSSGTYYIRARSSAGCWSGSRAVGATVNGYPSTPSTPSVSSNTCGNKTLTRGTPPSGVTWYWQGTNSNGYSTSNSSSTYSVSASGTYYIRARSSAGCWSSSRAVGATVNGYPATPSTPSVSSNTCGDKTLTRGTPPSGVTWYWQGTNSNGTSTSNSASTYSVSTSGTYYIRARSSAGCWSSSRAVSATVNGYPSTPSAPTISSNTCGAKTLTRGTPPAGVTWYWQGTTSGGTSTSNSASTYAAASSGTYYLRAQSSAGCWSTERSVSVTVNDNPAAPGAPTVAEACTDITLTRGTPSDGSTWYWQGTDANGTSTSDGATTYMATTSGTYYIRALSAAGCWSSATAVAANLLNTPAMPPAPTVQMNCGNVVLTRTTAPAGETWYWQGTDANGTSTADAATTYTATTAGNYYLRPLSDDGCWGDARETSVTVNIVPDVPTVPTVSSNTCGDKTLTQGTPPVDVTWYWQGTDANGTSTADAASTFTATASGTYYLRAQSSSGCWSATSQSISVTIIDMPDTPTINTVTYGFNGADLQLNAPAAGETVYWQTVANGTDEILTTLNRQLTDASVYYARTKNASGCWSDALSFTYEAEEPASLSLITLSSTSVRLVWSGVSGNETGFRISRSNTVDGTYTTITETGAGVTQYDDTGLQSSTDYFYRIQALVGSQASTGIQVASQSTSPNFTGDQTLVHTPLNNGNISAMKWKGANDDEETLYTFHYDGLNRLKNAHYARLANSSFEKDRGYFSVPDISYDLNGNILSLTRQGMTTDEVPEIIDVLTYSYGSGLSRSNQLMVVGDTGTDDGFKNGSNTGDDYAYDANGNMTQDLNKGINSIEYNHLNLPSKVEFDTANYISYMYDAAGIKLQQAVYDSGELSKKTDYLGSLIYENGKLELIQHEEGRIIPKVEKEDEDIVWSFNEDDEAFTATSEISGFQHNAGGYIEGNIDVGNNLAGIISPNTLSINADTHSKVRIRLENNTSATYGYLYFNKDGSSWSGGSVRLFNIEPNSGLQDYIVDIDLNANWNGIVKQFRVVPAAYATGSFKIDEIVAVGNISGINYDYQYHLKDHLGNVRLTFSTTPESYTMVETFETGEENGWQDLHRSTNANANTTVGGNEVELLQSGQTGAMIFIGVNRRDTVNLSVNANYENAPTGNSFVASSYNTLFTSFNNAYGGSPEIGGAATNGEFNEALSGANMTGKGDPTTAPRAFLNYIIFDKEMNYLHAGFAQVSTAAQGVGVHETISISDEIIAEQEGYVLAYLSNENLEPVNVHFDDFTVYHGKTNVVSTQDYYPFGLTFNESVRVASTEQRFKYNGFEEQKEWGVYDYLARYYDPAIGRFLMVDPAADLMRRHSPYNYAFDNPIRYIDPDGMMPDEVIDGSAAGGGTTSRTITSAGNTDYIEETTTQTASTKQVVDASDPDYQQALSESGIDPSTLSGEAYVTTSTTTTTTSNTYLEFDDNGNFLGSNTTNTTLTEKQTSVSFIDGKGGDGGGAIINKSAEISSEHNATTSEPVSAKIKEAIDYRWTNGVSITNRTDNAAAISRQQSAVNTFSDVNAFFGVGVGFSIRNASLLTRSGVGTAIGIASYGVEGSLRSGLESMKKRSPGCNNCTKGF